MAIKRIVLDMDGVLADFIGGICKHHDMANPYVHLANRGQWHIDKIWGMSPREFWSGVDYTFWTSLEKTELADTLVSTAIELVGIENVYVCTVCPDGSTRAYSTAVYAKKDWIGFHFPELINQLVFCKDKYLLANDSTVLVDDADHNLTAFDLAGGYSVAVPRPWNSCHDKSGNTNYYVINTLKWTHKNC